MASDALPQHAEGIVAATAGSTEHVPQALLAGLDRNGYRQPLRVVRLTGGRRAPVTIGVLDPVLEPVLEPPKVRVAIDASEPDAERRDVDGAAVLVGERAERRLQRE